MHFDPGQERARTGRLPLSFARWFRGGAGCVAGLRTVFGAGGDRPARPEGPGLGGDRLRDPARPPPGGPAQQLMTPLFVAPPPTFTVQDVIPVEIEPFDTVAANPLAPVTTAV